MKKIYLILIFLLVIPFLSAEQSLNPVKIDSCSNILQSVENSTFCYVTLFYPNGTIAIDNKTMTKTNDLYNYTFCNNNVQGNYLYLTQCDSNGLINTYPVDYLVNGYGSEVSTSQIMGYGILLAISILVLFLTIYAGIIIKFENNRDEEGKVISISDLKWLKIVAWVFAYLELIFIMSIAKNMALGFLLNDGLYEFLNIVYIILLSCILVLFPLLIFFIVVIWINDKKTLEGISRGIFE